MTLIGFQGLILHWASEAFNSFLRYLKNNGFKEDEGRKIRCDDMVKAHDPGTQQEPFWKMMGSEMATRVHTGTEHTQHQNAVRGDGVVDGVTLIFEAEGVFFDMAVVP